MLVKRVRAGHNCAIGEEQCGFRQGRGCIDQVFAVRQVCENDGKWERCVLGPDFQRVTMLRNGAVCMKQNLNTAHEFVVC